MKTKQEDSSLVEQIMEKMVSQLLGQRLLVSVARKSGCTGRELSVLVILKNAEEDAGVRRTIQNLTGMKRSNLSILLKKMERKGLIARDGQLRLTEEGREKVVTIADYYLAFSFKENFDFPKNKSLI